MSDFREFEGYEASADLNSTYGVERDDLFVEESSERGISEETVQDVIRDAFSEEVHSKEKELEEAESFVILLQNLKEPFDFLTTYMGGSLFFNIMKLNFELIADRIARLYLTERQRYGDNMPPELERKFVEDLVTELKNSENRIWDYIMWLIDVVEAKKRSEEAPEPPDWMYDIWW